jgi:UDP-glucose 4-epimerase
MYQTLNHPIASMCYAAAHGKTAEYGRGLPFADDGRGYCYVKDCATAIQLIDAAETLPHRIYNTSGGIASNMSNSNIVATIKKIVPDADLPLQTGGAPNGIPDAYQDISQAAVDVGYHPKYDIEKAVTEYIAWLKVNER